MNKFFAMSAVATALTAYGYAQGTPNKVAVINIQGAIVSTKDGQKAAADLETRFAPRKRTLDAKQTEINGLKEQYQKGANTLSEAAKSDLMRNIDVKTKAWNRDAEDAQAEFDQEQQKLLQDLGQKIMAVIDKYARDNGYTLILDVSNPQTPVLYASNTIDITKEIIDLYDKNTGAGAATGASAAPLIPRPPSTGNAVPVTPGAPRPGSPAGLKK